MYQMGMPLPPQGGTDRYPDYNRIASWVEQGCPGSCGDRDTGEFANITGERLLFRIRLAADTFNELQKPPAPLHLRVLERVMGERGRFPIPG